jgi:hypothetical protein
VAEHSTVLQFRCRGFDRAQTIRIDESFAFDFRLFTFRISPFRDSQISDFRFFPISLFTLRLSGGVPTGPHCVAGVDPCERVPVTKPARPA